MKRPNFLLICFLILGLTSVAGAETFHVSNPTEFQNALTAAVTNNQDDTIILSPGIYNLSDSLNYSPADPENYSLHVIGAGVGKTILDGAGAEKIFSIDTRSLSTDSNAHVTIEGITFQNAAGGSSEPGGAIEMATNDANMTIVNSQFSNNTSPFGGGGIFLRADRNGNINLINSIFNGNTAKGSAGGGAALMVSADEITGTTGTINLINNTIVANSTPNVCGGISITLSNAGDTGNIYNNIVWNNTASLASDLFVSNQNGAVVELFNNIYSGFSISQHGSLSEGNNFNQDPLLTADFHLQANSPAIDKGNNNAPLLPATDIEGNPRIVGPAPDIGAYEWTPVNPYEGTIGTVIMISGSDFGTNKGKVLIGKVALTVLDWAEDSIQCQLTKPLSPDTYPVTIRPQAKGSIPFTIPNGFTVKAPEIDSVDPTSGSVREEIIVNGFFFGTKKGKVTLDGKTCKVLSWEMDETTGESEIRFMVPKGLSPGTYVLKVTTTGVGSDTVNFTVE